MIWDFFLDILFDPRLTDYTIYKPAGIYIFHCSPNSDSK